MFEHWTVGYVFDGLLFTTTAIFLGWITKILVQKYVKYFKEKRDKSKSEDKEYLELLNKDTDLRMYLGFSITRRLILAAFLIILGVLTNIQGSLLRPLSLIGSKIFDDPKIISLFESYDSIPMRIFSVVFGALCYIAAFLVFMKARKDRIWLLKAIEKPPKEKVGTVAKGGVRPTHVDLFKDDDS